MSAHQILFRSKDGLELRGEVDLAELPFTIVRCKKSEISPNRYGTSLHVAAWGTQGGHLDRDVFVCNELAKLGRDVKCLGVTKDGHPKHPLYLPQDSSLQTFTPRSIVKKGTER